MDRSSRIISLAVFCAGVVVAVAPKGAAGPEQAGAVAEVQGKDGPAPKSQVPAPATVERPSTRGVADPLKRFFGPSPDFQGPEDQVWKSLTGSLGKVEVEVLIATVSDPKESRFGYHFDSTVDAIQLAIERLDYVQDQFWLPWTEDSKGKAHEKAGDARPGPGENVGGYEQEPGIIVFRHYSRGVKRLLVLLLVGETSTWGIQKPQLLRSLEVARRIKGGIGESEGAPFKVIGPFFSGSATSLRGTLESWAGMPGHEKTTWHYEICNGSATQVQDDAFEGGGRSVFKFSQTLHRESDLFDEMLIYFSRNAGLLRGIKDGDVALLVESGTSFGRNFQTALKARARKRGSPTKDGTGGDPTSWKQYKVIPFPTHISDVRAGFGEDLKDSAARMPRLITPLDTIPIPFGDMGESRDVVPALWPKMSAPKDSLVLGHILSTISAEGVRYLGVVATDTRDKIFLMSLINKFCPDVQIFLTNNDLLLTNPEFSHDLQGAIVASTYPLVSQNQSWSYPYRGGERRVLFAQESDQGCYNATLALLKHPDLLDYGPPKIFRSIDRVAPAEGPPIWISVIGLHGPWPVTVVERARDPRLSPVVVSADAGAPARGSVVPRYSLAWVLPFLGFSLAALVSYRSYRQALPAAERDGLPGRFLGEAPWGPGWFHPPDATLPGPGEDLRERRFYVFVFLCSITACYVFIAKPCAAGFVVAACHPFDSGPWDFVVNLALPMVAVFTLALLALATTSSLLRALRGTSRLVDLTSSVLDATARGRERFGRMRAGRRRWVIAAGLAAAMLLGAVVSWVVIPSTPVNAILLEEFFAFRRTVNIVSGISPLLPTAFTGLALCGWAVCQLRRIALLSSVRIPGRYLSVDGKGPLAGVVARGGEMSGPLAGPHRFLAANPVAVLAACVVAFLLAKIYAVSIPTVEGKVFDLAFIAAFTLVCLLTTVELVRFDVLQRRLRLIFREVAQLPMAPAFKELPDLFSAMFGRSMTELDVGKSSLASVVRQLDALEGDGGAATKDPRTSPGDDHGPGWGGQTETLVRLLDAFSSRVNAVAAPSAVPPWNADVLKSSHDIYVAMIVVMYVSQYSIHLRNVGNYVTAAPLLLLMATLYPFEPERFIDVLLWAGALAACGSIALAYVQFDRDDFVSWVAKTEPRRITVDWDSLFKVSFAILPLLGVLLTQFPDVSDLVYNYLSPLFRSLR